MFLLLMLALLVAVAVVPALREKLLIGWPGVVAIVVMAAAALTFGHLLGGPSPGRRSGLAIASIARNIGLTVYVANLCLPGEESVPTILAYAIFGAMLAIPYSIWMKRRSAEGQVAK